MNRKLTLSLTALAVALFAFGLIAEPALAQTTPSDAGDHFGNLIRGNMKPIVMSVGGVLGVAAIFKRDAVLLLLLVGVTVGVLGFLIKPSPYEGWGKDSLEAIFGVLTSIRAR